MKNSISLWPLSFLLLLPFGFPYRFFKKLLPLPNSLEISFPSLKKEVGLGLGQRTMCIHLKIYIIIFDSCWSILIFFQCFYSCRSCLIWFFAKTFKARTSIFYDQIKQKPGNWFQTSIEQEQGYLRFLEVNIFWVVFNYWSYTSKYTSRSYTSLAISLSFYKDSSTKLVHISFSGNPINLWLVQALIHWIFPIHCFTIIVHCKSLRKIHD